MLTQVVLPARRRRWSSRWPTSWTLPPAQIGTMLAIYPQPLVYTHILTLLYIYNLYITCYTYFALLRPHAGVAGDRAGRPAGCRRQRRPGGHAGGAHAARGGEVVGLHSLYSELGSCGELTEVPWWRRDVASCQAASGWCKCNLAFFGPTSSTQRSRTGWWREGGAPPTPPTAQPGKSCTLVTCCRYGRSHHFSLHVNPLP